jgi:hypothetical protein
VKDVGLRATGPGREKRDGDTAALRVSTSGARVPAARCPSEKRFVSEHDYLVKLEARARTSRKAATKLFCIRCMGGGPDGDPLAGPEGVREMVRTCTDVACPLHPHRPYTRPVPGSGS